MKYFDLILPFFVISMAFPFIIYGQSSTTDSPLKIEITQNYVDYRKVTKIKGTGAYLTIWINLENTSDDTIHIISTHKFDKNGCYAYSLYGVKQIIAFDIFLEIDRISNSNTHQGTPQNEVGEEQEGPYYADKSEHLYMDVLPPSIARITEYDILSIPPNSIEKRWVLKKVSGSKGDEIKLKSQVTYKTKFLEEIDFKKELASFESEYKQLAKEVNSIYPTSDEYSDAITACRIAKRKGESMEDSCPKLFQYAKMKKAEWRYTDQMTNMSKLTPIDAKSNLLVSDLIIQ